MPIIEVSGLTKHYGAVEAVRGIDVTVEEGALFAFLGPNGAGKSTTINIMCTLAAKTAGSVRVAGFECGAEDGGIRAAIGVVFQQNVLDDLLSVRENLLCRAALYGITGQAAASRVQELSGTLGLGEFIGRRYGKLSGGQKRRAEIARALMHTPRILVLDEPTTGLDPQTRRSVWDTVSEIQKSSGMTVFLTTHYMEEAANADMVAIIDHGLIAATGAPSELRGKYSSDRLRFLPRDLPDMRAALDAIGTEYEVIADIISVDVESSLAAYALLKKFEGQYSSFEVLAGNMDNVFINITGHAIREEIT